MVNRHNYNYILNIRLYNVYIYNVTNFKNWLELLINLIWQSVSEFVTFGIDYTAVSLELIPVAHRNSGL